MTPRDRLQRLLFEHRTAHDPASSEREILRMFEELGQLAFVVSTDATQPDYAPSVWRRAGGCVCNKGE